ncbi:MAG: putative membrane protein YphA (DoxX/SURF4 family) [Flammeovirgaceae bacterium]|jgi:vitamin K-dependent gamma-carboxylase
MKSITQKFFKPIDIAPLVFFRIFGGLLMTIEITGELLTKYRLEYLHPTYHLPYPFFEWLTPWGEIGIYAHMIFNILMGICVVLGFYYRITAFLLFLGTSSHFLMEHSVYINHIYLYWLLAFLLTFIPAHRAFSLDARRNPEIQSSTAPAWCRLILLFQISLVYFFAGIAKVNPDWFNAIPMKVWLNEKSHYPIIGGLLGTDWYPYLVSYGGVFFDLLIVPAMIWRKTRKPAFIIGCVFHIANVAMFGIGTFPWISIVLTSLFFPPEIFRKMGFLAKKLPKLDFNKYKTPSPKWQKIALVGLGFYVFIQLAIPMRQFFYGGNLSWHEAGHNFSWHMMLRSKRYGSLSYKLQDSKTGKTWQENPQGYLTRKQYERMKGKPDQILFFAHFLKRKHEAKYPNIEVYAHSTTSLNFQPAKLLVDSTVNLANEQWTWGVADWVMPFEEE